MVPARRHRDPGGRVGGLLAWVVIVAGVVLVLGALRAGPAPERLEASREAMAEAPSVSGILELQGRYAVGARQLGPGSERQILVQLERVVVDPADKLRMAMLAGELIGAEGAVERLDAAEAVVSEARAAHAPPDGAEAIGPTWFDADVTALRTLYTEGPGALAPSQREGLETRHGWFGRLALVHGQPDTEPRRAAILAQALRFMMVVVGAVGVLVVGLLAGAGLSIAALVGVTSGWLRPRYHPPAPGGSVYLEAFALFLAGFLVVQAVSAGVHAATGFDASRWLIWLLPLCALWPIARGASRAEWRHATGWHAGKGVLREIGAGLVGYVAGLPIFALGVAVTAALVLLFGPKGSEQPSHPIVDEAGKGGIPALLGLYLLASVWAPLTEETMFRGCFYHHLRGRLPAVGASLVTAFIFAVIHPQGWLAVPALMGLAVPFALMREWRGSLIGPIVAHALHNGALVTILSLALRQ